ncbi:glutathione peroxidase [Rhodovulum sp. ES.010]|uniref:glutathione peroxidase n=1 Tax=Rhodovulum sp. ES.010 TaxID=1882821 RepID=UPI0009278368|nr:glutathione peroxidase [Rhodovulum sp. ES.010]SIO37419.1 glutathione peroxidase [Rhodovulum sp. ES.010]
MRRMTAALALTLGLAAPSAEAAQGFRFDSIDGGEIALDGFRGQPVLVVNTASQCGFTPQYDGLQTLHDRYGAEGLVVLAVPSDDFKQELSSEAAVKEFCDVNFGLTLPMTEITHVKGADAHPFYKWLKAEHGFAPRWNFNKVLIGPEGEVVDTYGSLTKPTSRKVTRKIEALLAR